MILITSMLHCKSTHKATFFSLRLGSHYTLNHANGFKRMYSPVGDGLSTSISLLGIWIFRYHSVIGGPIFLLVQSIINSRENS